METLHIDAAIKLALEEMIEGIQIIDLDWKYIYVNNAAAIHGKKPREELIGRTMMEAYPGIETTSLFKELRYVVENRRPHRIENEFEYENRHKLWFELFIEPHPHGILIRSVDITERKKLEEQLRHSQKIEAVGRLAGGIAHDFNNKLGIMLAFCEMALDRQKDGDIQTRAYLAKIQDAITQSARLTKQLLAFSRKQVLDLQVNDLNALILKARDGLQKLIGEHIAIEYHLDETIGKIRTDAAQMDQVILNLCINARDAMPEGGTLSIETSEADLDRSYAETHPGVIPGRYVVLSFSDTGVGMDKETLSHAFEPFFTTKENGKGTGLGLAMVHGIVNQSRGHIWVYSEPGMGTTFKLYFPKASDPAVESQAQRPATISREGNETILLVEDDPLLREAYEATLHKAGYKVHAVGSPTEAESIFMSENAKIDLLLTDVVLPRMNGKELADRLQKHKPDLKLLYMSGYTENSIVHKGVLDTQSILLQKPISIKTLLETVRKVLDGALKRGVI